MKGFKIYIISLMVLCSLVYLYTIYLGNYVTVYAKIKEVHISEKSIEEGSILVDLINNSSIGKEAVIHISDKTKIYENKNRVDFSSLKKDDNLKVLIQSNILESYPPQVFAVKINKK